MILVTKDHPEWESNLCNGILPVTLDRADLLALEGASVTVDLMSQEIRSDAGTLIFKCSGWAQ